MITNYLTPLNGKFILQSLEEENKIGTVLISKSTKMSFERALVVSTPMTNIHEGIDIPHGIVEGDIVLFDPEYGYDVDGYVITGYHKIIAIDNKEKN